MLGVLVVLVCVLSPGITRHSRRRPASHPHFGYFSLNIKEVQWFCSRLRRRASLQNVEEALAPQIVKSAVASAPRSASAGCSALEPGVGSMHATTPESRAERSRPDLERPSNRVGPWDVDARHATSDGWRRDDDDGRTLSGTVLSRCPGDLARLDRRTCLLACLETGPVPAYSRALEGRSGTRNSNAQSTQVQSTRSCAASMVYVGVILLLSDRRTAGRRAGPRTGRTAKIHEKRKSAIAAPKDQSIAIRTPHAGRRQRHLSIAVTLRIDDTAPRTATFQPIRRASRAARRLDDRETPRYNLRDTPHRHSTHTTPGAAP